MTKSEYDQLLCDYVAQLIAMAENLAPGAERDRVVQLLWAAGNQRITATQFEAGARVLLNIGAGAVN